MHSGYSPVPSTPLQVMHKSLDLCGAAALVGTHLSVAVVLDSSVQATGGMAAETLARFCRCDSVAARAACWPGGMHQQRSPAQVYMQLGDMGLGQSNLPLLQTEWPDSM